MFDLPPAWWRRLRDNSRSFFLTVRVLPGSIRPQIGLAYLLARASDTIADTSLVAPSQRLAALEQFAQAIQGPSQPPPAWDDLARRQGRPAERDLLEHAAELIGLIRELDPADASDVRAVLATITGGQQLDLTRFAS
ncbi:MAG: squalene/phytoene synthase family protein, partial [Verrucomicrobia bacterium]|nr:squalene/phytoene synthase family protein [Verrucomicrobiota bacterium]